MTLYHLCDLATETGEFGIFDCVTQESLKIETDAACRQIAERRWPGCHFVVTTTSAVHAVNPDLPPPEHDLVVIAVCRPISTDGTVAILAYVFGAVHRRSCVPFTPDVWPDAHDLLIGPAWGN